MQIVKISTQILQLPYQPDMPGGGHADVLAYFKCLTGNADSDAAELGKYGNPGG